MSPSKQGKSQLIDSLYQKAKKLHWKQCEQCRVKKNLFKFVR
ncbi:hypothetical protein VOA_002844 [Vibrio sp. RC586]|nr:hypothetical protein VOA_002844 [Vibrio sp. RC586]